MSLYLCAVDSNRREHVARFVAQDDAGPGGYEAKLAGLSFALSRESAARHGLPGSDLYVLRLRRTEIPGGMPWMFDELRVAELPLHPATSAAHAGGFQCWSESPVVRAGEILRGEAFPEREVFGDACLVRYPERRGRFHSWSLSYTQLEAGSRSGPRDGQPFFGALDEDLFFARFEFDLPQHRYAVAFDTAGASFENMRTPLDRGSTHVTLAAWVAPAEDCADFPPLSSAVAAWARLVRRFERVQRALPETEQAPRRAPVRGYTSWYLHYNAITEAILLRNVEQVAAASARARAAGREPLRVFQVDDGYQRRIGDWLDPSDGFPRGVRLVAQAAREAGLTPGIWCAPFICTENSALFAAHPDWLLKDPVGRPVPCGNHPLWGGRFYALDTENQDVLAHLDHVLRTYFKEWDFRFLKADFLYATARTPAGGLTRAQRSARAHEWLYRRCLAYGAKLLSCGSTLSSAAMRCDYSRIGPDVAETWENTEFGSQPSREKVTTRGSLVNAVTRAPLSGVLFGNDPDVFHLRDERLGLARRERETLARVNHLLGDLVFTSDEVGTWGPWQEGVFNALPFGPGTPRKRVASIVRGAEEGRLDVRFTDGSTLSLNLDDAATGLAPHTAELLPS